MKKLSIALIAIVLCLCMVFAVACDNNPNPAPETPTKVDMINGWAQNDEDDEGTYEIDVKDGVMVVEYNTSDWQFMFRRMTGDNEAALKAAKTLVVEGKLESEIAPLKVTLKLEFTGDDGIQQVHVMFSETARTYEWDVSEWDMSKCLRILLFVQGGKSAASGTLTINKMFLTPDAINSANDVVNFPGEPAAPVVEHEVKQITATDTKVDTPWYGNSDIYTVAKVEGGYKVDFKKNGEAWAGVLAYFKGDVTEMKSIKFTIKGSEGLELMLKPFDSSIEPRHTCTGGDDEVEIDISALAKDASKTDELKLCIIAAPGSGTATGSFIIKGAEFSTKEVEQPEQPAPEVVNEITAEHKEFANWYHEAGYTLTVADGKTTVVKAAGAGDWSQVKAFVTGEAIGTMKTARIVIKGTAGTHIIFKPLNVQGVEENATLTGESDEIVVDISSVDLDFTGKLAVLLFVNPLDNDPKTEATFVIESATFSTEEKADKPAPEVVNEITAEHKEFANWYHEVGYTLTVADGKTTVVKAAGAGDWSQVKAFVTGEAIGTMKTARIVIKGTAGTHIIFKPLNVNGVEESATLTGESDEIVVDISSVDLDFTGKLAVLLFVNPLENDPKTEATFVIESATFSTVTKYPAFEGDITSLAQSNPGQYTVSHADGVMTVSHTKDVQQYTNVNDRFLWAEDQTLKITVKNVGSEAAFVKVGVQEIKNYSNALLYASVDGEVLAPAAYTLGVAKELDVNGEVVFVITVDVEKGARALFVALNSENETGKNAKTGSITVKVEVVDTPAELVKEAVNEIKGTALGVNEGWYDGGQGKYDITEKDGVYTVAFTKGGDWDWFKANLGGDDLAKVQSFIIKVKGTAGTKILIKPFDDNEAKFELTGGEDEFFVNITNKPADKNSIVIMIEYGADGAASGSIQILSARFSYGRVNEVKGENTAVAGWYDEGLGKYTVTVAEGVTTAAVAGATSFSQLKLDVCGAALKTNSVLKLVLSGAEGDCLIVNALGTEVKYENDHKLPAGDVTVTVDFSSKVENINANQVYSLMIFYNWDGPAGSLVIKSAEFVAPAAAE